MLRNRNSRRVSMIDLAAEIVTAIASGAGGSLGAKGTEAMSRLLSGLRARFRHQPESRGALEISVEEPGDLAAREHLVALLREHMGSDDEFAAWLANLWAEVRPALQAGGSVSANVVSGTVHGSVVQARDIQGGIRQGG
jgi:hypothetical protein